MFSTLLRDPVRLSRDVHQLIDAQAWPGRSSSRGPAVNLWQDGDSILIEAELPGFAMEDIEVLASESTLTLRGRRDATHPENASALRIERSTTRFERTISLPTEIDPEVTRASLKNGVLLVSMPIAASARPKRIEVKALSSDS